MIPVTKSDLDNLARKRRVKASHRWFTALTRSANKTALPPAAEAPKYSERP